MKKRKKEKREFSPRVLRLIAKYRIIGSELFLKTGGCHVGRFYVEELLVDFLREVRK